MNTTKDVASPRKIVIITCISCILAFFGVFVVPLIPVIALIGYQWYLVRHTQEFFQLQITELKETNFALQQDIAALNTETKRKEIERLNTEIQNLEPILEEKSKLFSELKKDLADVQTTISQKKSKADAELRQEINQKRKQLEEDLENIESIIATKMAAADAEIELKISQKQELVTKEVQKIAKFRELYKSIRHSIDNFFLYDPSKELLTFNPDDMEEIDSISPSVLLHLQNMNSKELRKAFRQNDRQITKVMEKYSARYTTKANQAIYALMVIALRAELQNILSELKYDKLDTAITSIKKITLKYLKIAGEGNQLIVGTLTKFIGQLEYLFINAAKIEYNYYVKKEKERQEQLALKEKMREEAAERKALEVERKKIEKEELKYQTEITKIKEQLQSAAQDEIDVLNKRILELQSQLSDVILKKEDIINLQNGRAGTVYIISNLGSFGDDVFKIGMTRRLDPQERVNELGSASVPFKFDVHSFIFSEDAVSLENKIHELLNHKRVNKVNLRKEFFRVSLDEIEKLVEEIEPTADFNRTMLANEYRASISSDQDYTDDFTSEEREEDFVTL